MNDIEVDLRQHKQVKLLENALSVYNTRARAAYRQYTDLTKAMLVHGADPKSDGFKKTQRVLVAKLSAAVSAASKAGKAVIINHYIKKIAAAPALNLSAREAMAVVAAVAGRSVDKTMVKGLFKKQQDNNSSNLYFKQSAAAEAYRLELMAHPLIVELGELATSYDGKNKKMTNPYKAELTEAYKR